MTEDPFSLPTQPIHVPVVGDALDRARLRTSSRRLFPVPPTASVEAQAALLGKEVEKLHLLLDTVRDLGTELSLDLLMSRIASQASKLMNCARTSVFLLSPGAGELYSLVAEGLDRREIRLPSNAGIVGSVVHSGQMVNIPDAYLDERFNADIDKQSGFRTRSVLCVPLHDRNGRMLGCLQCLNKRGPQGQVIPFEKADETFAGVLGNLAGVFLENAKLYMDLDELFEAIVSAVSRSIDNRDPCTSGHSRRVTRYALALARAVHESEDPPFAAIRYTRERLRQLRFAGLLHDVGKIGVREYVLCKATRLPPNGAELICTRLELMLERHRAEILQQALDDRADPAELLEAGYAPLEKDVRKAIELVKAKDRSGFVSDEELARLQRLREQDWITAEEFEQLSIKRGNLTAQEWEDMRSHVTKSWEMLIEIPWPPELRELPEVAYTHHEKLDGSGYPRRLKGEQIHFDGQIMVIADIYDALTASDRPYKKAIPHEVAKKILVEEEANQGKLNADLVRLFFEKECYLLGEREPDEPILTEFIPVE